MSGALTLDALADRPRWVGWRNEPRAPGGKVTKVPFTPGTLNRAKADNPASWRTRREAEAWAQRHVNGQGGGIGIELGELGDGISLGGIDLDTCRDLKTGAIAPWASEIISRFGTYTEISPSGTGVKVYLTYAQAVLAELRQAIGNQWSKEWKSGAGEHPAGIEIHLGNRYFATTGDKLPDSPDEMRLVPIDDLLWLIREAGPAFKGKGEKRQDGKAGQDVSRSAAAFRLGARLRRQGKSFDEMVAALHADPATAEWAREKGAPNGGREFRRIWEKAAETDATFLTEDGVAQKFAEQFRDQLRYDHHSGRWHQWDGVRWRREETKLAFDWVRAICRKLARDADADGKLRAILGRASTAGAVERFAQADRAFAVTSELWDRDSFLLGTPGGTVDLRTGKLRPARQSDYITKITAVTPAETPDCPLWLKFLKEATLGDQALIRFIQQWFGYALTGDIREHALLFVYGAGGNGKSVLLNTISGILGDYQRTSAMETFTSSTSDRHPTELAMLKGARLVCASETEEDRSWAESRIKQLTGGDTIAARFMRQDFFEYRPEFKLTIIGNNKPALQNVDDASRRRINMLPFVHKPPAPDQELEQKLRAEWPAILRWMIDGCLDWQMNGLVRPQVVIEATDEYFLEQDSFRQWVEDCCEVTTKPPHVMDTNESLFSSWQAFASARGEKAGSSKRFAANLKKLYCVPIRNEYGLKGRGWRGIRVRMIQPDPSEERYR